MNVRHLAASAVVLLGMASCENPVCACVVPASALVVGRVSRAGGASVSGTRLFAYVDEDRNRCIQSAALSGMTDANSQGEYRLGLAVAIALDSVCVFVRARAPQGSGLRDTLLGPLRLSVRYQPPIDSTRLDVVLSP
jgi:hypothetical protein